MASDSGAAATAAAAAATATAEHARLERTARLARAGAPSPGRSSVPGSEWIYDKALLAKALSSDPDDPADRFDPDEGLGRVAGLGQGLGEVEMLPTWFVRGSEWSAPPQNDGTWPVAATGALHGPTSKAVAAHRGGIWFLKETNRNFSAGVTVHGSAEDCLRAADPGKQYVVQPHYRQPMLRPDGRKFHLRIYLAAVSPPCVGEGEDDRQLRWYIYRSKELLMGRVATSSEPWSPTTLDREVQIITRRTFALREEDWPLGESNKAWVAVYAACKAVLAQQLSIHLLPDHSVPAGAACHELFGIDIALRDDWVVHVIEINAGPGIEGDEVRMVEELEALTTQVDGQVGEVHHGGWELLVQCTPEKIRSEAAKKRSASARDVMMMATKEHAAGHTEGISQQQFQYVLLPTDEQEPVQELTGLLPVNLSSYGDFASEDALPELLRGRWERGEDGSDGVEQFALLRPSDSTQSEFVFAYGGPGMLRQATSHHGQEMLTVERPNKRATAVAMECGFHAVRFHGDVIIGRSRRVDGSMVARRNQDFTKDEAEIGAPWQAEAVRENYLCGVLMTGFADRPSSRAPASPPVRYGASESCEAESLSDESNSSSTSSSSEEDDGQDEPSSPEVVAAARSSLVVLYTKYRPDLIAKVDTLLRKYAGIEREFVEEVRFKYEPQQQRRVVSGDKSTSPLANDGDSSGGSQHTSSSPLAEHAKGQEEEAESSDVGYCFGCHKPSTTAVRCAGCAGVFWCRDDPTCATMRGWTHDCLCRTWRRYSARRESLTSFPFPWAAGTCADPLRLSEAPYAKFLYARGLAGKGWWKTELQHWVPGIPMPLEGLAIDVETKHTMRSGFAVDAWAHPYPDGDAAAVDRDGASIDQMQMVPADTALEWGEPEFPDTPDAICSWESYYRARDLSPSSPAALLLTFPLTLYHLVTRYGDRAAMRARVEGRSFRIHLVGCEKEIHLVDSFAEFGRLLCNRPGGGLEGADIELTMVVRSDCVPARLRGGLLAKCCRVPSDLPGTRLTILFAEGSYGISSAAQQVPGGLNPDHDVGTGPPDLIIGFNAGLYAYKSWTHTVLYVLSSTTPAVFTDYNEHSATECAKLGGSCSAATVAPSPFRQPREMPARMLALPSYSNAFEYAFNV